MPRSTILRALRSRNYRLFFGGQGISLVGTWLTRVATSWLVYRLTDSALLLGIVGFAGQFPAFLLAPIAGVVVDRWSRHRLLLATQVLAMLQSFALAALAISEAIEVGHVVALSVLQGVVNAFDMPARQAFVVEMVERREDLPNAIALNSTIFNGARLVGPSAAGVLIAAFGEGTCFLIDGLSYLAVIASLLAMRLHPPPTSARHAPFFGHLAEGFRYAFGFAPIRAILVLLALVSLAGFPYTVLMPVFARDILGGDSHLLGFLTGAGGVGALGGALYMASRRTVLGLGKVISLAGGGFGAGLVAFSLSPWIPLSLVAMLATGFCMMVQMASSNTVLQTLVDDDKRGRVMSIYTMAFVGMAPFGSLAAGASASALGAPATVLLGGVVCIAGAFAFASSLPALRREARPIYVKRGIVPEIAEGLRSATELSERGLPED